MNKKCNFIDNFIKYFEAFNLKEIRGGEFWSILLRSKMAAAEASSSLFRSSRLRSKKPVFRSKKNVQQQTCFLFKEVESDIFWIPAKNVTDGKDQMLLRRTLRPRTSS